MCFILVQYNQVFLGYRIGKIVNKCENRRRREFFNGEWKNIKTGKRIKFFTKNNTILIQLIVIIKQIIM